HPRWLATVLCYESELVYPDAAWSSGFLMPESSDLVSKGKGKPFTLGLDRYADIRPDDLVPNIVVSDEEPSGEGVYALTNLSDLSIVVVPDLSSPEPLAGDQKVLDPFSLAGSDFAPCVGPLEAETQTEHIDDRENLRLDPRLPADLKKII